jgi:hypothetical protein
LPTSTSAVAVATATPPAFPAFADWRVAYIGADGSLDVTSLDGKNTQRGAAVALYDLQELGTWAAGTSPDGRHLAISSTSAVMTLDLQANHAVAMQTFATTSIHRSATCTGRLMANTSPSPIGLATSSS